MIFFYRNKYSGFTLIELMIVVAIVAILAAVALPSYQRSVQEARRTDAKTALLTAVTAQEKWFFQNGGYSNNVNEIGGDEGNLISSDGDYTITIDNNIGQGNCVGAADGEHYNCFTLTATPVGAQANDTDCAALSINHRSVKAAANSVNVATTDICW